MPKTAVEERPRVVLVNRCLIKKERKLLLIQRSKKDSWEPQKWELPGGKIDLGQDLKNALEREVLEETGLYIKATNNTTFTESYVIAKGKYTGLPYVVIVYKGTIVGGEVKLSHEHEDFCWCESKEALDMDLSIETRKAILALEQVAIN